MLDRFHRLLSLAILAALLAAPLPLRAEGDIEAEATDEGIGGEAKALRDDARAAEAVRRRLETLKQQHEELEFRKRTKAPFTSERSLRHELRRNEAQQGWEKREERRLEYERQQREQDIRNRTRDWQRER